MDNMHRFAFRSHREDHQMAPLVSISGLTIALPEGGDRSHALDDVALDLHPGEIHCVVGESGSGKSMTAMAIMGLLAPTLTVEAGTITFRDRDLLKVGETAMRSVRGREIGMIFQEPMTALNPLRTIGDQIAETYRAHTRLGADEIAARVQALLADVHIPDPKAAARAYPHELSGGQRQRAMIAMALALSPAVLVADEPTTALDVTTQAQILSLIRELQARSNTAVLFITHDFGVVAEIADRVTVMQHGKVVEHGTAEDVLHRPRHPYTRSLIAAVPSTVPPKPRPRAPAPELLRAEGVEKTYRSGSLFRRGSRVVRAVDDVSLTLERGTTLGIVGESGSGKSTLARLIVRLIDPDHGSIHIGDTDIASLSRRELRRQARRVQMVFQDPHASLNPRRRAGDLVAQGLRVHGLSRGKAAERARDLFRLVGLDPRGMDRFPHEFSGGQRQRIGLARALAMEPEVLVADEPVSALDVSVQAQILDLFERLKQDLGLTMVFITHDLRVAAQICDRIAVMRHGRVV
jgi:peptide/nickel transport system ATP-binding protein